MLTKSKIRVLLVAYIAVYLIMGFIGIDPIISIGRSANSGPASLHTLLQHMEGNRIANLFTIYSVGSFIGFILGVIGWIGLFLVKNWGRAFFALFGALKTINIVLALVLVKISPTLSSGQQKSLSIPYFEIISILIVLTVLVCVYSKIGSHLFKKETIAA